MIIADKSSVVSQIQTLRQQRSLVNCMRATGSNLGQCAPASAVCNMLMIGCYIYRRGSQLLHTHNSSHVDEQSRSNVPGALKSEDDVILLQNDSNVGQTLPDIVVLRNQFAENKLNSRSSDKVSR